MIAMKALVSPEAAEVMNADYYRPAVSLTMPFEPKVNNKSRLVHSIKLTVNKLENALSQDYPAEVTGAIMQRIKKLLAGLNYGTFKKSIAIFASAAYDKLLYLDQPVEEKIIIDDSFNIRQIILNKKQEKQFLVVILSSKQCCVYLAEGTRLERKLFKSQAADYSFINAEKEKVSNFTDASSIKSIQAEKFLLLVDHALHEIINAYNLPVFILASEKTCGHFKQVTRHNRNIFEYIHGNYMDADGNEINELLVRIANDWDKMKEQELLRQLEDAANNNELVHGVLNVFRTANSRNGKLLVVEKEFSYNSKYAGPGNKHKSKKEELEELKEVKARDVVDEIIERVLEYGGDVAFVNKNVLKKYQHIALIKFH
jgi:hypothetical protein